MLEIRTRFAPSPTGFLHLGGVRTMLFSWLLARKHDGKFYYRIEDTDRTRLVPESVASMVEDFTWLDLDIDEGPTAEDLRRAGYWWPGAIGYKGGEYPFISSLRLPRYREVSEILIRDGFAYRCNCSPEKLETEREKQLARGETTGYSGFCRNRNVPADVPHVVRFRIPEGSAVTFHDAIRGTITWDPVILRDMVILKTDGFPTYHLGATVDDHDTGISHVLRGEEWISTTPLHYMIYKALDWKMPVIAHLPVILGNDGKKLSKRHGATFSKTFREDGYLPDALLNYLLLQGWSPGEGSTQELFSREEMVAGFSLENVKAAPSIFSFEKLNWMNGVYIRKTPDGDLARLIEPFLTAAGLKVDENRLRGIMPFVKERMTTLKDALPLVDFLFLEDVHLSPDDLVDKKTKPEDAARILSTAAETLQHVSSFDPPGIEGALRSVAGALNLPARAVLMTVRVAVTGRKTTPPLFESISILGCERTIARLKNGLAVLEARWAPTAQ